MCLAPRVRVSDGSAYGAASVVTARTANAVPMSGPEYTTKRPSGAHTGSSAYSLTNGDGARPSSGTPTRRGMPPWTAAEVIDWPSGAHAGAPCNSSDLLTTRAFVPSACMT